MKVINPRAKNYRQKRKKSRFSFSLFLFYFSALAFAGGVIYCLFFSHFLTIASVEVSGYENLKAEKILGKVESLTEGKILGLVEKNNFLFLSSGKIERELLKEFRQMKTAEARKIFPAKINIEIEERKIGLIVCGKECFLLDDKGQTYDDNQEYVQEAEKAEIIKLKDLSEKEMKLNEDVLSEEFIASLYSFKKELDLIGLETENYFETPNLISKDIRLKTAENWKIYFNEEIGAEKEVKMLKAVLEKKIGVQRADLDYVDLRINDKVYYKFRDGTEAEKARAEAENVLKKAEEDTDRQE